MNREHILKGIDPPFKSEKVKQEFGQKLARLARNPLQDKKYLKIVPDRNIVPEKETEQMVLEADGRGATNIIQNLLHKQRYDRIRKVIDTELVNDLNEIFAGESKFDQILSRQLDDQRWEIYLEEEKKGQIPLTSSGNGLKTVILVLMNILVIPTINGYSLGNYIFSFEELENNLHPGLQRKLLTYIRKKAADGGAKFFITTHSSVLIDLFNKDESAQILHVVHDGEKAIVRPVETYIDNKGVLDDLDVRASDLLQANCIVWVEGPSDRLYLNHWLNLISKGLLKEGVHYQCIFYGGRLLSHLTSKTPFQDNALVNILTVNKNAVLIMDSDKREEKDEINDTKKRIVQEVEKVGGYVWITKGREIENYIPTDFIKSCYNNENLGNLDAYDSFPEFLLKNGLISKIADFKKVNFSAQILNLFQTEKSLDCLDLKDRVSEIYNKILRWNHL